MRPALFVQDLQNVWLYDPDSNQGLRRSVEARVDRINAAIAWFRTRRLPIVVGYTVDRSIGLLPGTAQFETPKSIKIKNTDFKVTKLHANAFANQELARFLQKRDCDTLVILGLSASGCVLATYFGALDWEIRPYLLKGCVASAEEKHVRFAEEICDTLTLRELGYKIRSGK